MFSNYIGPNLLLFIAPVILPSGMKLGSGRPATVKLRTGVYDKKASAHKLVRDMRDLGADLVTVGPVHAHAKPHIGFFSPFFFVSALHLL
jgi:hypothetical protein